MVEKPLTPRTKRQHKYATNYYVVSWLRGKHPDWTGQQIATEVGLTRERVRQLLTMAAKQTTKLREHYYCSRCGKELIKATRTGMCRECQKEARKVPCIVCGALITPHRPSQKIRFKLQFCSHRCSSTYYAKNKQIGWGSFKHRPHKRIRDYDQIYQAYVDSGLSYEKLGLKLNIPTGTVSRAVWEVKQRKQKEGCV